MQSNKPANLDTKPELRPENGPQEIDPSDFSRVAGGSPRGGWGADEELSSPRGGWDVEE